MRKRWKSLSPHGALAFVLTVLSSLTVFDFAHGILPVRGTPVPPPANVALQFDALISRFSSEQSGYTCYLVERTQDRFVCLLEMPCSMSVISVQDSAIIGFGTNFGGSHFVKDPRCVQSAFLAQTQAMLEFLAGITKDRAQEIVVTMDRDPRRFERCIPGGELPEGTGGLSSGLDDSYLKIFCWTVKQR